MKNETTRKINLDELNELSLVGGADGSPEPRCSVSNIIITTVLVSIVSLSYLFSNPEQCK